MRFFLIFLLSYLLLADSSSADLIESIRIGELDAAKREAASFYAVNNQDGKALFAKALLEADGKASLEFLTAAVRTGLPSNLKQEILCRTVLYYLAGSNYTELAKTADIYLQEWPNGEYRPEMSRLAALSAQKNNEGQKAEKTRTVLIKENPDNCASLAARLDWAANLFNQKKYVEGRKIGRRVSESKCDEAVVPALYMLTINSLEQKNIDDAIFAYNLLKDGYSGAIGLEELEDRFSKVEKSEEDQSAEKITGTIYSVQVGVFSKKDNALRAKENMTKHNQPVDVKEKIISGKTYFVVYVGRFQSSESAIRLKNALEISESESYQVVAR
jgi:hypothetical protein